jgi:hypothetical protein
VAGVGVGAGGAASRLAGVSHRWCSRTGSGRANHQGWAAPLCTDQSRHDSRERENDRAPFTHGRFDTHWAPPSISIRRWATEVIAGCSPNTSSAIIVARNDAGANRQERPAPVTRCHDQRPESQPSDGSRALTDASRADRGMQSYAAPQRGGVGRPLRRLPSASDRSRAAIVGYSTIMPG